MSELFNLDSYLDKAERLHLLESQDNFVLPIRLTSEIRSRPKEFEKRIKKHPEIIITQFANRRSGPLRIGIPSEISFNNDFLIKKRPTVRLIKAKITESLAAASQIDVQSYIVSNFADVKRRFERLPSAVAAAEFLLKNSDRVAGLFPRQIPHGQSTKLLIEDSLVRRLIAFHLGKPQLGIDEFCEMFKLKQKPTYFHIYAERIRYDGFLLEAHHTIITSANVGRFDFAPVERIIIVENEETFHSIHDRFSGVAIHGHGDKAASLGFLAEKVNQIPVFYWGDMDKAGYEAFKHVREVIPHAIPIGMDMASLMNAKNIWQITQKSEPTLVVPLLGPEYEFVCTNGIMVEQEQLPVSEILEKIMVLTKP